MKKLIVAFSVFSVCLLEASAGGELPSYRIGENARDPFDVKTVKRDYTGRYEELLKQEVWVKGVAKKRDGRLVGIFNKGIYHVGDVMSLTVGGDLVRCELVKLDRDSISASFKIGTKIYKVTKK